MEKETYIHAKCSKEQKTFFINQAKKEGLKLTDWIVKELLKSTWRNKK